MDAASFVQRCSHAQQGSPELAECVQGQVQEYVTSKFIALFTYLAFVAVVGLIGNSLILVVYLRGSKKTATIVFICAIAVTDLLTNLLVIPWTFYVLMNSANVEPYMCKMYFFLSWSATTTSVFLLLAVAVVRYRKICVPFGRQVTLRHARSFSIGIAVLSIVLCIPHTVVYGRLTVEVISSANLTVYECAVDDEYANSKFPKIISGLSILIFLLCCVPLTVMYLRIGIEAQRRRPAHEGTFQNSKSPGCPENKVLVKVQQFAKWNVEQDNTGSLSRDQDTSISETPPLNEADLHQNKSSHFKRSSRVKKALNRTTVVLITITIIYILTNLTSLVLILVRRSALKTQISFMGRLQTSVFNLFLYSFISNSAVNAIIYTALDKNFRIDCLKLIRRI